MITLAFLRSGVFQRSPQDLRRRVYALAIGILLLSGVLVLYNTVGGVFLQFDYYYETYTLYLSLAVAAPIGLLGEPRLFRVPIAAIAFVAALLFAALAKSNLIPWLYLPANMPYVATAAAILVLSAYAAWLRSDRQVASVVYVTFLVVATLVMRPNYFGEHIWSPGDNPIGRQAYARLRNGLQFLADMKFQSAPKFWVDTQNGPSELLAYPRSFLDCTFYHFPAIDPTWWKPIEHRFLTGDDVIVISSQPNLSRLATLAFSSIGLSARPESQTTIYGGGQQYEILVERVTGAMHSSNLTTEQSAAGPARKPPLSKRGRCLVTQDSPPHRTFEPESST